VPTRWNQFCSFARKLVRLEIPTALGSAGVILHLTLSSAPRRSPIHSAGKLIPPTAAPLGSMGPAAASGMASTALFMRRRWSGIPRIPPSYHPMNGNTHMACPKAGSLPKHPHGIILPSDPRSSAGATPEDLMAACDRLSDSVSSKVLNAYCAIMASVKGKGARRRDAHGPCAPSSEPGASPFCGQYPTMWSFSMRNKRHERRRWLWSKVFTHCLVSEITKSPSLFLRCMQAQTPAPFRPPISSASLLVLRAQHKVGCNDTGVPLSATWLNVIG